MLVWTGGKEPAEIADFDIDWSARLGSDTILTSTWAITVTDGQLVKGSDSWLPTRTKVWLSAGTSGVVYTLKNTVTTVNGDTLTEEVQLLVALRS